MKQNLKKWLMLTITLIVLAITQTSLAQAPTYSVSIDAENWSCGIDEATMAQLMSDTGFVGRMTRYNNFIENPPGGNQPQSGSPFIIPVVFHIIQPTGTPPSAVTYAQIQWQVARFNAGLLNQMTLFNGQAQGSRAVNTQIEFRLACVAQNCNQGWSNTTEPGVMRYYTNNTTVLNQNVLAPSTFTPMLAITHPTTCATTFPFANYLNIWCVPTIGGGNVIGYGTFPWLNAGIDGIVMDIDAVGNNSYPTNFPLIGQLNKGAVLTHEIGHYLGLYHTFETMPNAGSAAACFGTTAGNATTQGDLILDTPPTFITADLGSISQVNSCHENNFPYGGTVQDQNDQLENYMSYSDDDKLNTFTQGQANRMQSAFTNMAYPTRINLNNPTNLLNTGTLPQTCSVTANILTGIFNYSIAPGSNCNTVNIQFTNPLSVGFNTVGTTYSWNFGNGTGTGSNPIRAYNSSGGLFYVVSCTATNGTATATFTQNISINFSASITNQSGLNMPVCRGTEQTIYITVGGGVPFVTLTDGVNQINVPNNGTLSGTQIIPYTFVANASASYSIFPIGCGSGVATFSVMDCCNTLITNGDFSSNTGFNTQLTNILNTSPTYYGTYTIVPVSTCGFIGALAGMGNQTGDAMLIDGFSGQAPTLSYSIVAGCNATTIPATTPTPIIWQQTVTGLQPSQKYYYSFKISENFNNHSSYFCDFKLKTSIYNTTNTLVPTQTLQPIYYQAGVNPNAHLEYVVYTYSFVTSNTITPAMTFSVEINQIENFYGTYFDMVLDNITLNQMTPSIQATGTNTICLGQSTPLNAVASCNTSTVNFNYVWSPNVALSSNTIINPVANPTATTVYTLVATPTATGIPASITTVTVTVRPTFTVSPPLTYVYSGSTTTTLTVNGNAGPYTWMPGSLTGTMVVVTPSANTVYTVTSPNTGTCTLANTATVIISTACSQSINASYSNINFPASTTAYTVANTVYEMNGVITFTGNTTFTGYTIRMRPGTKLKVNGGVTLTFNNCKLFGCTELWYGIELNTADGNNANISVQSGTTIEDMYYGIYREIPYATGTASQGYINITNSTLNKNYYGVQLINVKAPTPAGSTYSLTVKNSTLTSASSITSPGNTLKPSTIPTYTYAYNTITGGASGSTTSYTAFPRAYTGINLVSLSATNNVLIGDSAGAANTFNTFSNLDFGIVSSNAQLRVHNNYFYNLKGSTKQVYVSMDPFNPTPTPIGPDEIGIAVVAQHTVANTYSLQVGTRNGPTTMAPTIIYPKSNIFKTLNKGISAKNCNVVIAKCNWFEGDTTDTPITDITFVGSTDPTYSYLKAQSAVWITGLTKGSTLSNNYIRNYRNGLNVSQTMSITTGAYVTIKTNNIQSLSNVGYCKQAINLEQVGGANIATDLLDVSSNTINKVYNGIAAKTIAGGLKISNNTNITLDNVKTYGKPLVTNYSHTGISLFNVTNGKVLTNTNINGLATITASNYSLTNAVYVTTSASNTITCNTANNVGRGFYFQGNCTSPNGWLGNGIRNSYRGLELKSSGVIGIQGAASGATLAANTWSNVTQETFVSGTTNVNINSIMYVEANGTYTTAPNLNFGTTGQVYINGTSQGIDIKTGTPFSCGGGGTNMAMAASAPTSGSSTSTTNDALYSSLATNSSTVYPTYADEMEYQNQQLVFKLQKQGLVTKNATNPTLQSFYNTNISSNIGKFTDVQDAVASNNKTLAQSKNNSISPSNAVQQKTKRANELMLKLNMNCNYQYTSTELQDLTNMANECEVKGWYVAQSRSILNTISGTLLNYADNCEDTKANARMANEEVKQASVVESKRSFNLYPNPNNGSMTMAYDLGIDTEGSMNLYDVAGKLINTYNLSNTIGTIEINEAQLHNGIYFYCILVNGIKVNTNKIVIIK